MNSTFSAENIIDRIKNNLRNQIHDKERAILIMQGETESMKKILADIEYMEKHEQ